MLQSSSFRFGPLSFSLCTGGKALGASAPGVTPLPSPPPPAPATSGEGKLKGEGGGRDDEGNAGTEMLFAELTEKAGGNLHSCGKLWKKQCS